VSSFVPGHPRHQCHDLSGVVSRPEAKHGHDLLDAGGEFRRLTCTHPQPLPAPGHEAKMLDVEDPDLGYDAETFPHQQPQRGMRPTCRAGLLGG
jgi:hypothetical protein